ncbi:hypothetical protein PG999_002831 [Apiospora kogelbergensis]|uniref:C2H2-type domain-containing protein n=1 Tax=Apiospora kogelbergensis TaxID=1337665 RepID=A0AAW0R9H3_9PEZI
MEQQRLPIGFRVGFNDEDLDFGSQPASSASSARSFSTASSSCDPYTPTSGRSPTPSSHQPPRSAMEEFEPVICSASMGYEMTPPTSDLSGYYPVDVKSEYAPSMNSENMLSTPMRKLQVHDQMLDFDFNHVLGTSMPPSGNPYESTNPHALQHYPLHESMTTATSPPMELSPPMGPTPSYTFNQDYDEYPPWPPQMTNSHPLDCNYYGIPEPSNMHIHIDTRANAPASVLRSNVKRKVYMDNAQRRGSSLQKVHGRHEAKKEISEEQIPVSKIPKAVHMCDFPGCEKQTAFKRREHLRRHQNTKHGLGVEVACEFCDKRFNRRDNWRQHLRLHTEPNRPMTRTDYNENAVRKYEEERNNTKRRRPPMRKQRMADGEM